MSISVNDVTDILDTDVSDGTIETYISQAGKLVTNDDVKTWLAAHLIRVSRDRAADKESVGDHSVDYSGKTGSGLDSTRYGQTAQTLDIDGELPAGMKTGKVDISEWT